MTNAHHSPDVSSPSKDMGPGGAGVRQGIAAEIRQELVRLAQPKRAEFSARLLPGIDPDSILGVSMPDVRRLARNLSRDGVAEEFFAAAPHSFVEENMLHMLLVGQLADVVTWEAALRDFIPRVDNWMVSDCVDCPGLRSAPKTAKATAARAAAAPLARELMRDKDPWAVRVGLVLGLQVARAEAAAQALETQANSAHADASNSALGACVADPRWITAVRAIQSDLDEYPYVVLAAGWFLQVLVEKYPCDGRAAIEDTEIAVSFRRAGVRKIIESRRSSPELVAWARQQRSAMGA